MVRRYAALVTGEGAGFYIHAVPEWREGEEREQARGGHAELRGTGPEA